MPTIPFSKRFRQRHPRFTRGLLLMISFSFAFAVGFAYASWAMVCRAGRCPSANALDGYEPRQTSKLYAADGRFIAELGLERRTLVKFADIPPLVREAFVVTEDRRFYQHAGIDWYRVPGAMIVDIKNRSWSEGFSTITMQLARNIFPERISRDKTVVRKLKEAKVARAIEQRYSKDRILELYLNQIYLGSGAYGIESAAQRYFGKTLKDLNVAEAAMLAALPKGPERYNPRKFPERAVQRRNLVIDLLEEAKIIDAATASEAKAYPLRLATRVEAGESAPYFVDWIRQQLDDKFGRQLYEQGLKVYTTLDLDLQSAAERSLERQIRAVEAGKYGSFPHISYERYSVRAQNEGDAQANDNTPYLQGAFVAMDPRTGAIRALVGGRDFDDSKFDRAVQAVRQPGSTFKPIVYADAVQNGRPLSYLLDDSPLSVDMGSGTPWTPQNFEGDYTGKIPMRRALYQSRNVPTIRLGLELGVPSVIDEARKFGLSTPIPGYPSIFIGAADVYPIEMVAAYSAFATLGTRATPMAITRVEDSNGDLLWQQDPQTFPVLSPEEAWLMVSVMKDVVQRGTAAGSVGAQFHYPAGGKTGTTNDGTDVWFIGYTSDLVAGVWMGFDKPQKIKANAQGGILAAPVWTSFMNEVYRRKPPPRDWPMPADIVTRQIDVATNTLATPFCQHAIGTEFFIPGTDPITECAPDVAPGLYPDTSGLSGYPASPGSTSVAPLPPGAIDTSRTTVVIPGRVPRPLIDSTRRYRDTSIFVIPRRDSTRRPLDSTRIRRDSTRIRPDSTRIRPDSTRIRPDSMRIRPDSSRSR
ncbi:MAG: penicillin-binding protein 1A [Gemmatimonadaceae bacterium]